MRQVRDDQGDSMARVSVDRTYGRVTLSLGVGAYMDTPMSPAQARELATALILAAAELEQRNPHTNCAHCGAQKLA